jgi:hypothetical protein
LKAYETLINPALKLTYDYKLNYAQTQTQTATTGGGKKYKNFEEQELKRKRYYDEHIKKYEKKKNVTVEEFEIKENYNEFKYILFATPLAVILFLLIVNFASNDRTYVTKRTSTVEGAISETKTNLTHSKNQNSFHSLSEKLKLFGQNKFDLNSSLKLEVKNNSGSTVAFCLFDKNKKFIRFAELSPSSSTEMINLPNEKILVKYCIYNSKGLVNDKESVLFFKSSELRLPEAINPVTLLAQTSNEFIKISSEEFFEHTK